jgi:hypothetical protein
MSLRATPNRTAFLTLLATLFAVLALAPTPAGAAVAYRQQTCKSQTFLILGSFSMNKPAGVVSGDVMIATMRVSSFLSFSFSTPSGWTEIAGVSDNSAKLYYKVAGGSEPASYNFGSMIGLGATMIGTIVAFSGVDTSNPIGDGALSSGSGSSVSLPVVTATRNGSVKYSNVTTSSSPGSTFLSQTDACDLASGGISVANGFVTVNAGDSPSLTDSLTSSTSWVAQSLILQPASLCATGGLTLSAPSTVSFPSTTLDGTNRTITTNATLSVSDMTDSALGWNLTATSTQFTSGGNTLSTTATTLTGVSVTAGATNCGLPVASGTTFPITLPAGAVAPPATKIYSASLGTGLGIANLAYTFALALPANTRIGTYTSTWTFTLASGP